MNARGGEANLALLAEVAARLGVLRGSLVFVGGCATGLLVTAPRAQPVRMTLDVDLVAEVTTLAAYHKLERQFERLGFVHDASAGAPICRWRMDNLVVDLMPSRSEILGFANPWYPMAIETAQRIALPGTDLEILLIRAPEFLATKLVAFKDRGRSDYLASHDLEDFVTIVDGRDTLHDEVVSAPPELRHYIADEVGALLRIDDFVSALGGHLPGDAASQSRLSLLLRRLRRLAEIN
jgi:predicted nucleotidyltransferase